MPNIAIYALLAAALLGVGYGTAWKQAQYQIITLETQRDQADVQSRTILRESTKKVEQDKVETSKRLELLSNGYNEAINRINASTTPSRMYITTNDKRCTNTLRRSTSTNGLNANAAATAGQKGEVTSSVRIELPSTIEKHLSDMGDAWNKDIAALNYCLSTLQAQVKK